MSTIVTRSVKGSPLTHNEVDANFNNLNTDKIQSGNTVAALTITSATINGGAITGITDLAVADGGTGASTLTANNVLLGNGTSALQVVAPSTTGNVLTSNGTTWVSQAAGGGFTSGTLMLFQQTAAPTGWTKQTTHNNKALRVVSGTASSGGTTGFTTVFTNQTPTITTSGLSAGATTLTTAQIPSHAHQAANANNSFFFSTFVINADPVAGGCGSGTRNAGTGNTGGGGSHTHTISGTATSTAITLDVQYVDLIIASKD